MGATGMTKKKLANIILICNIIMFVALIVVFA
jgi:hypothetical protein